MAQIGIFGDVRKWAREGWGRLHDIFYGAGAVRSAVERDWATLEEQVRELSLHSREMALLGQAAEMLQACADVQELGRVVAVSAKEIFPTEAGVLYILGPGTPALEPQVAWGGAESLPQSFEPGACWAIRRSKPHYRENPQEGLFCAHAAVPLPAFTFCLPLTSQGGTLGLLYLSAGAGGALLPDARQLTAIALAYQIALGLSNLRLKEVLREEAIRDPVTGLFNRRYMNEALEHEIQRARRTGTALGVIAFDIDHFKEVNDSLGHAAGDAMLLGLAGMVKAGLRAEDICCRQGGDEFLLILPDISEGGLLELAEVLRKKVEQFTQDQFPGLTGRVTLSEGLAMFPRDASTAAGLLKAADGVLYQAKSLGRNRIVSAGDPMAKVAAPPRLQVQQGGAA